MLRKWLYLLGMRFYNPRIPERYAFLRRSESWSLEDLRRWQRDRCAALLKHAYAHAPFYRRRFDAAGLKPEDFRDVADLAKFPLTSKSDLLANGREIQTTGDGGRLLLSETSGSTGEPLMFHRDLEWDANVRAAVFRGYAWHGVNPWDRNGYFWGYNLSPSKRRPVMALDFLQNRFRVFSYDEAAMAQFAKKLRSASFLEGYSSMIYETAKIINRHGWSGRFNLKMVKGTSEKIFDSYQEEARRAFGRSIISEYGSAECGVIAFECAEGAMHIVMENVIVEEIEGEAVITNLNSRAFPVIRYRQGDYIELARENRCPCGMAHPILADVRGRVGRTVYGLNGKYPSLTFYYVFKNLGLDHGLSLYYQAIQRQKGQLEIRVEQTLDRKAGRLLEGELRKYFKDDMGIRVLDGQAIRAEDGKVRDFVSYVEE